MARERNSARTMALLDKFNHSRNAEVLAQELKVEHLEDAHRVFFGESARMRVQGLQETLTPTQAAQQLGAALRRGHDVQAMLEARVKKMMLEGHKHSLGSTRSALLCWQGFATAVFQMPAEQALPPKAEADIMMWLCTFKCWGAAMNYCCAVRWCCVHMALSTDWWGPQRRQMMRGAKKWHAAKIAGTIEKKALMNDEKIWVLVESFRA